MGQTDHRSCTSSVVALVLACLLAWPSAGAAQLSGILPPPPTGTTQTVTGSAQAVQATVLGTTTTLADTGTLAGTADAREASQAIGSVSGLLGGEALHAVTISWPDQVSSEASIASLGMTIAGTGISADLVMARAHDVADGAGSGVSNIDNLTVGGAPIFVTGAPNQMVWFPGGQLVINEQIISSTGATVNALHVTVWGVADVVIASAKAGI